MQLLFIAFGYGYMFEFPQKKILRTNLGITPITKVSRVCNRFRQMRWIA